MFTIETHKRSFFLVPPEPNYPSVQEANKKVKNHYLQSTAKTGRKYELMNLEEAAQKLGIATQTLYSWCQMRRVPYFKIGGFLKFDEEDLDRFISEQRVEPISY